MADTEDDYGMIRPSLIKQLRSVLDMYPDDGQILKELIQNAEDAGATVVRFVYDENNFPVERLHDPDMAKFQGPALFAYNDGKFEQKDWRGIRMLQDSVKEKEPMKVGRFGLGFKSVLHMTDLPSVLSCDRLFMIDPHEKYFRFKGDPTSGYAWRLKEKREDMRKIPDQFRPYMGVLDCSQEVFDEGFYEGTLFRFPFRKEPSDLSDTVYDDNRIMNLFESFKADAPTLLLFLKNLERIEFYKRPKGQRKLTLLYEVKVADRYCESIRYKRREFSNICKQMSHETTSTYQLQVETIDYVTVPEQKKQHKWLVTEHKAGQNMSENLTKLSQDASLSLIPLVGLALCMNSTTDEHQLRTASRDPLGQIFCFLPLPTEQQTATGLPVHVNGYFSISQNRRHLKWPTTGFHSTTDKPVQWNQCLLKELIPRAYIELLCHATQLCRNAQLMTAQDVYNAIPDVSCTYSQWKVILEPLFRQIAQKPLIQTTSGMWSKPDKVLFDCMYSQDQQTRNVVNKVLQLCRVEVASVPSHVYSALEGVTYNLRQVNPDTVREQIRKQSSSYNRLTRDDKLRLLKYLTSDREYHLMQGIQLLPCMDGSWRSFGEAVLYIPTTHHSVELFPGLGNQLLDFAKLDWTLKQVMTNIAEKGSSWLHMIDKASARNLIQQVFPAQWLSQVTVQLSRPRSSVTIEWFKHLWDYLRVEYPYDLSQFEGLPLIPITNDPSTILLPLRQTCPAILSSARGFSPLDESLKNVLKIFGVCVLDDIPNYVTSHGCVLGTYVKYPQVEDIVAVLFQSYSQNPKLGKQAISQMDHNMTPDVKLALVQVISSMTHCSEEQRSFLQRLPIFPTFHTANGSCLFKSIDAVPDGSDLRDFPCEISTPLIDISQYFVRNAAKLLRVKILDNQDVLERYILLDMINGHTGADKITKIMDYIFKHFGDFSNSEEFVTKLSEVPFVDCGQTLRKKPSEVCDPQDTIIQDLYAGESGMFPAGSSASPQMLIYLRQIGLKTSVTLTIEDLLDVMKKISKKCTSRDITRNSRALLQIFDAHPEQLDKNIGGKRLREHAKSLQWVPVKEKRPLNFPRSASWHARKNITTKPDNVRPLRDALLCGSVSSILDVEVSDEVMSRFGWAEAPTIEMVVDQLEKTVQGYQTNEKPQYLTMINEIYKFLIKTDGHLFHSLRCRKQLQNWVWHGDGFTSVDSVFIENPFMDLRPHVQTLPNDMTQFLELFTGQGMDQSCSPQQLVNVLHQLKRNEEEHEVNITESKRNLQQAVGILNHLKDHVDSFDTEMRSDILVPTVMNESRFNMVYAHKCTFVDLESSSNSGNVGGEITFLHGDVPWTTAEKLGVTPLIQRILNVEDFGLEAYGQTESLTIRLKNLLRDYSDGLAIFKEMIQNADDAGADEVCFLYDERENENMGNLLDEGMKTCQGPALWVYNNSIFTDKDFDSIIKLGGATKEDDEIKIGKFGLGFNSVYNITDTPSFFSGTKFVVFDPHRKHLGKALKDNTPGIRLDVRSNKAAIATYAGQFRPFHNIYGCDLMSDEFREYKGSLFRLPLRTKDQAYTSEISCLNYSKAEMISLLKLLIQYAPSLLLFTQNVKKIKVDHISKDGQSTDMSNVYLMEKDYNGQTDTTASKFLKEAAYFTRNEDNSDVPGYTSMIQVSYETSRNSLGIEEKRIQEQSWLITEVCGSADSLKLARGSEQHMIPVGGIAMLLNNDVDQTIPTTLNNADESTTSQAYCFLPLPITTCLPVHINGTFAIDSSRQHLNEMKRGDKNQEKAKWNIALMQDAVTGAYQKCLQDMKEFISFNTDVPLYKMWPTSETKGVFHYLCDAFYSDESKLMRLPFHTAEGELLSLENVIFFNTECMSSDVASFAISALESCTEHHVLQPPQEVIYCMEKAGYSTFLKEKCYDVNKFFEMVFFPNLKQMDPRVRDKLIIYALEQSEPRLNELLTQFECIPSSPKGKVLQKISNLIDPRYSAAGLFKPDDGRFPHGEYAGDVILTTLQKLGMCTDTLSWPDIVDRACSVKAIMQVGEKEGKKRLVKLLGFMDKMITPLYDDGQFKENEDMIAARRQLQDIEYLQVLPKPKEWKLPWKGDELSPKSLFKASDLHPRSSQHLASSTALIVDDTNMSNRMKLFLDLNKKTEAVKQVLLQFNHAVSIDPSALNKTEYSQFSKTLLEIYSYLDGNVTDWNIESALKDFASKPCLLLGKSFVKPSSIAFRYEGAICHQHLHKVSEEYRVNFQNLLKTLGVKENFEVTDFIGVLNSIQKKARGSPLKESQLKICINVIGLLNENMENGNLSVESVIEKHGKIYVPNKMKELHSSTDLCYDDCPWIGRQDLNFAHGDIPYKTSCCLGIKTKIQQSIHRGSVGMPFGQKERLTNSIKRILKNYPRNHQVLKELIQNADDAGATEIHFVMDGHTYGKKKLFDKSWEPLQGPALCVYNNKPFTEVDLEGIQKLGEGSKKDDPCKTGQYGIGFSSVYHLTDVPSILTSTDETGEILCVFDPNCLYVPGANKNQPGMKYETTKLPEFSDVFSCYHKDSFDDLKNGTMIRLPLRTEEMAEKSFLSEDAMTMKHVHTMMDELKEELFDVLLFTNNLNQIKISEVNQNTGKLQNIYSVRIESTKEIHGGRPDVMEAVKSCGNSLMTDKSLLDVPRREFLYILNIKDSKQKQEKWCISQIIGFKEMTIPEEVVEAFERGDLLLSPRGGCAMRLGHSTENYIKKAFCLLPLPDKTGLPMHVNGHFALAHENRGSVWGNKNPENYNYKDKWNELLCSSVVADCYVNILEEEQARLKKLKLSNNDEKLDNYEKLFPVPPYSCETWINFIKDIYRCIDHREAEIFPVKPTFFFPRERDAKNVNPEVIWVPPRRKNDRKVYFSKDELELDPKMKDYTFLHRYPSSTCRKELKPSQMLQQTLLSANMLLVRNSSDFGMALTDAGIPVECVTPASVTTFLRTNPELKCLEEPCQLEKTVFSSSFHFFNLLKLCKKDENFLRNLHGLPLLLTKDKRVGFFNKNKPTFTPKYCDSILKKRMDRTVDSNLYSLLSIPDGFACGVLVDPTLEEMIELLPDELPPEYCADNNVEFRPQKKELPSLVQWFISFWKFVDSKCKLNNHPQKHDREKTNDDINDIEGNISAERDGQLVTGPPLNMSEPSDEEAKVTLGREESDLDVLQELEAEIPETVPESVSDETKQETIEHATEQESRKSTINHIDMLKLLDCFSLIPCIVYDKVYFYTVSRANNVVNMATEAPKKLHSILRQIGVPEFVTSYSRLCSFGMSMSQGDTKMIPDTLQRVLLTSSDNEMELLSLIHNHFLMRENEKQLGRSVEDMSPDDATYLLKHFVKKLSPNQLKEKSEVLRYLPLHVTVYGQVISLSDISAVYTVSNRIPTNGMDCWQTTHDMAFLKEDTELLPLYELFQCEGMTIVDIYNCDCILQHLDYFSENDALVHLLFLYKEFFTRKTEDDLEKLVQCLKVTNMMKNDDGVPKCAGDFYDPKCRLFFEMLPEDHFPPMLEYRNKEAGMICSPKEAWLEVFDSNSAVEVGEWSNKAWMSFLRKIGLVQHPDSEKLLGFARQLAQNCSRLDMEESMKKAKLIIEELFEIEHFDRYNDIRQIKFIPQVDAKTELHKLHPQFGNRHGHSVSLIQFEDSISCSHQNLIWTCMVMLPDWAVPSKAYNAHMKSLRITPAPAVDKVIQHTKNLVNAIQQDSGVENVCSTASEIFGDLYEYLDSHELDHTAVQILQDLPFVLVQQQKCLAKSCQTVVNLCTEDEIKPYLYKIPSTYGKYVTLFEKLGATESPTVQQYARVLADIKTECGAEELSPDQIYSWIKAVCQMFKLTEEGIDMVSENPFREFDELILLNENGILQRSETLVFNDAPAFRHRLGDQVKQIPLMADLQDVGIGISTAHKILSSLPKKLRPRMLSKVVREKVCDVEGGGQCHMASEIQHQMHRTEFLNAIKRLIHHECYKTGKNMKIPEIDRIVGQIAQINVIGRKPLRTSLSLDGNSITESEIDKLSFLPMESNVTLNLYVHDDETKKQQLLVMIGNDLNKVVENLLGNSVVYVSSLLTLPADQMEDSLTSYDITKIHQGAGRPVSNLTLFPRLGATVPVKYMQKLIPIEHVEEGNLVACLLGEEPIYAKVVKQEKDEVIIDIGKKKVPEHVSSLKAFHK